MYFESLHEILSMDGHGFYVWLSYGVSLVVLFLLIVLPLRAYKKKLAFVQVKARHERCNKQQ